MNTDRWRGFMKAISIDYAAQTIDIDNLSSAVARGD